MRVDVLSVHHRGAEARPASRKYSSHGCSKGGGIANAACWRRTSIRSDFNLSRRSDRGNHIFVTKRWTEDGQVQSRSKNLGTIDFCEARRLRAAVLARWERERTRPAPLVPSSLTLDDLVEAYLADPGFAEVSKYMRADRIAQLRNDARIRRVLGPYRLEEIGLSEIQDLWAQTAMTERPRNLKVSLVMIFGLLTRPKPRSRNR